ncbi:CoA ester lyase [Sinomonas notoginsengisoli]|uniref:HpcH/HpaI aldolase/citrate lyase family protein n=1 Tax=Sinomonas notoginsengisoli TaxID=1457311 RepID=UPI001F32BB65|nr:aldolase/citrate lyase family protein [Sinomonas notoginsengisoli]
MIASHLYVPADQPRLVEKGLARKHGAVILDLEDAVAPARKDIARQAALSALGRGSLGASLWVRVNAGAQGVRDAQLLRSASRMPGGVWIAKAEDASVVRDVAGVFAGEEDAPGVGLLVESAKGLLALDALIAAGGVQIQIGEIDLAADLGHRGASDEGMGWARSWAVVHSSAYGLLPPVAPVSADYADEVAFRESCGRLRDIGFGSRACIHPRQAAIADQVFTPTPQEVAAANLLVDEYELMVAQGKGAFSDSAGAMADAATVRRARRLTGR